MSRTRLARPALLLVLVVALAAGVPACKSAEKKRPSPLATTVAPAMPQGRTEVAGAFWNGKIAVAGGFPDPSQSSDRLDLFDVAARTWSSGPALPHRYDHASLAELGGRLYLIGGYIGGLSEPTNEVWSLGPGEASWTAEASMSTPRGALAAARAGGKLVAIGGVDQSGAALSSTEIFTPGGGWAAGPSLGIPREHVGAAGVGNRVYAIAGRNGSGATRSVESLAIGAARWEAEPDLHDARSGIGAGVVRSGRLCTAGGEVPGVPKTIPSIECLTGSRWQRVADLRVPRHGLAVVAEGERLHLVAGGPNPGFSFSDAHEVLGL